MDKNIGLSEKAGSVLDGGCVERMIVAGHRTLPGSEEVNATKRDGSWNALGSSADLEKALASYSSVGKNFDAFPRLVKRGILEWKANATRPETRTNRIEETAQLAEDTI